MVHFFPPKRKKFCLFFDFPARDVRPRSHIPHGKPIPPRLPRFGIRIAIEGVNQGLLMASIATIQNRETAGEAGPLPVDARIQRAITRIAESDCPVLILGEHGAGKRSIAGQIHAQSNLSRSAFKEIRCGEADAQALQAAFRPTEPSIWLK